MRRCTEIEWDEPGTFRHTRALHMLQGPKFDLVIDGGSCEEDIVTGIITCTQPSVTLTKTPGACNLKYTSPTVIQVSAHQFPNIIIDLL